MKSDDIQHAEDNWRPSRADELASQLLDEDATEVSLANTTGEDRGRVVDLQWLDAMLEQTHGRNAESVTRGVAASLTRLRADDVATLAATESNGTRTRSRRWALSVIAASIVVAVGLLTWPTAPASAAALIEKAYQAALQATDREYRVTRAGDRVAREYTLHVHGGDRFLLSTRGPLGRELRIGRDGDEFWFAPAVGPVFIADSESFVGQWLERASLDMPYLQLTTLLARMRDRYELSVLPDESVAQRGPTFDHLRARRRDTSADQARLPETIELWANRQTGVVQRLVLNPSRNTTESGSQTITFDLVNEQPQPQDFYRLSAHALNRPVVRVSEVAPKSQP